MLFDDISVLDYVFIKIQGERYIQKVPLCELDFGNGDYDKKLSTDNQIVINDPTDENGESVKISYTDFKRKLESDLYLQQSRVMDFVVQPGSTETTEQVRNFLERFQV